jgi:hypothetical protein
METSAFTIEFPEHLPRAKWQYCLDHLSQTGATIREVSATRFQVECAKPKQLADVGWLLFHTHFAKLCRVVSVSGDAEVSAGAYRQAPST